MFNFLISAVIATHMMLWVVFFRGRFYFLKPTIWAAVFLHIHSQIGALFVLDLIVDRLAQPWPFVLVCGLTAPAILGLSLCTWKNEVYSAWRRMVISARIRPRTLPILPIDTAYLLLLAALLLCIGIYLSEVPLRSTGLWVLITDPLRADYAREESLKLVASSLVRYSFAFMASALATVLVAWSILGLHRRALFTTAGALRVAVVVLCCLAVALPGTRAAVPYLLITAFFAWMYWRGLPFTIRGYLITFAAILAILVGISVSKGGEALSTAGLQNHFGHQFWRIAVAPIMTGIWHFMLYEDFGAIGIKGIPKLAALFGETAWDVPNMVALEYGPSSVTRIMTVSAVTSSQFSYYTYFGWAGPIAFILLTQILDLVVVAYRYLPAAFIAVLAAVLTLSSRSAGESDLTTVFVTHGLFSAPLALLLVRWVADDLGRRRRVTSA